MSRDIDAALHGWDFNPGVVQARLVQAADGRQVIQMRVDLGILQLETQGRPDGTRPHGFATYFDYLHQQAEVAEQGGGTFTLSDEQAQEADREFVQFYHRRLCWLALHQFARAVADSDHTIAFMDFVRDHSPNEEFTQAHEQYRGFVVFQRTQAQAMAREKENPEAALDAILEGIDQLRSFFAAHGAEDQFEENGMVQQLRRMEQSLRQIHNIEATLREQLDRAVANEQYEVAAKIRDALRRRADSV